MLSIATRDGIAPEKTSWARFAFSLILRPRCWHFVRRVALYLFREWGPCSYITGESVI